MATHLDLEEQEQVERLKHFWRQYGNLITWTLILVLGAFAAWNGWNYLQRDQGLKASALYDELERAAQAGDAAKVRQAFDDLRSRHARTAYAGQGGLVAAHTLAGADQPEAAREALRWVADKSVDPDYRVLARLRLAGLLLDEKAYDEALALVSRDIPAAYEALAADRRGDIHLAQGRTDQARQEYQKAHAALDASLDYRRVVEAKLTALGAAPSASDAAGAR
jgi:predicted negative regulator of RcsB-dependent stress response